MTEKNLSTEDSKKSISELQASIYLLLEYAITRSDIDVKKDFLNIMIPLLRNPPESLTTDDEIKLWQSYNDLSKQVAPATVTRQGVAGN